jgi:hypothetical protein
MIPGLPRPLVLAAPHPGSDDQQEKHRTRGCTGQPEHSEETCGGCYDTGPKGEEEKLFLHVTCLGMSSWRLLQEAILLA